MHSALEIATYFIHKSHSENKPIVNKKLQKLVYYSQVWHLVFYGSKLFKEGIEAWIHGPVIPKLFTKYKNYSDIPDTKVSKTIKAATLEFLDDVWVKYGKYDADYLESLTHSELPWQQTRQRIDENSRSTKEIDIIQAKNYYAGLLAKYTN